jgi:hypothetical protein
MFVRVDERHLFSPFAFICFLFVGENGIFKVKLWDYASQRTILLHFATIIILLDEKCNSFYEKNENFFTFF